MQRVRVWDLPLRLFHWLLVVCLIGSFVSVKAGEGNWMEWHYRFGYVALTPAGYVGRAAALARSV